MIEKAVK